VRLLAAIHLPARLRTGFEGWVAPVATSTGVRGGVGDEKMSPAMHSVWKGGDKPLHPL
jgi:hypothetical protein